MKRLFDILTSALGLLVLSPFFLLIAILIKKENPGPVFFHGLRLGREGKPFSILKFRTMREEAASYNGSRLTSNGDGRITSMGRWLRQTKVNELPQLWNVLKGEMSLVGPRPEDPVFVEKWPEAERSLILSVRPGITSPASITYRDEEKRLPSLKTVDDYLENIAPDKLRLDVLYVQRHSFLSDLDVIFLTLVMLLPNLRETRLPERAYFSGPLYQIVRRYLSWFTIDVLTTFFSISIVGVLWRLGSPLDLGVGVAFGIGVVMAILFSLFNYLLRLDRISWRHASLASAFKLFLSSCLVVAVMSLISLSDLPVPKLPLGLIWEVGVIALLGMVIIRYRERLLSGLAASWVKIRRGATNSIGERALIVGAGELAQMTSWMLKRSIFSNSISIVGMVDDDPFKVGLLIGEHRVVASIPEIPELVTRKGIGIILFAINNVSTTSRERILALCRGTQARVVIVPDLLKILRDELKVKDKRAV